VHCAHDVADEAHQGTPRRLPLPPPVSLPPSFRPNVRKLIGSRWSRTPGKALQHGGNPFAARLPSPAVVPASGRRVPQPFTQSCCDSRGPSTRGELCFVPCMGFPLAISSHIPLLPPQLVFLFHTLSARGDPGRLTGFPTTSPPAAVPSHLSLAGQIRACFVCRRVFLFEVGGWLVWSVSYRVACFIVHNRKLPSDSVHLHTRHTNTTPSPYFSLTAHIRKPTPPFQLGCPPGSTTPFLLYNEPQQLLFLRPWVCRSA